MTDVHSPEVRSYNMSCIKSKNTKPELLVRKYLFSHGFRYRLLSLKLPGKPDITLPRYRTVIFVHGCFWHGHEKCRNFKLPKSNLAYWSLKIEKNKTRDLNNLIELQNAGWCVIIIWECEIKKYFDRTLQNIIWTLDKNKFKKMNNEYIRKQG